MRKEQINDELKQLAFGFFYYYSRFEFALKEHKYLKNEEIGETADAGWEKLVKKFAQVYVASESAKKLIGLHPKRQIVSVGLELNWRPVGIAHCNNDLCRVVVMLKTIRNNLFHGGKHGDADMDSIARNIELLTTGKVILDELSDSFSFKEDYLRVY